MTIAYDVDTGIPPRAVQAWFMDLQPDDHTRGDHPRILRSKPGDYRNVISKTPSRVEAEDGYRGGKNKVHFVLTTHGDDAIDYDVEGAWYTSKGRLEATPIAGGGSHVKFRSDWTWKKGTFFPRIFLSAMLIKAITDDFAAHVRDMEEDWKKQPW